jgi:hypothetical protein
MTHIQFSERGQRCADIFTMHVLAHIPSGDTIPDWNGAPPWIAIRLSDGGSDGSLYPSKADAVRHQLHPEQCAYLSFPPGGLSPAEAESILYWNERMYEAGVRLADPDMQVHTPVRHETRPDVMRQLREK